MIEIPGLVMNNGWKPCFPGGEDIPENGEDVLALFYIHGEWGDLLTIDLVIFVVDASGGRYWCNSTRCDVHPLCWHPLPELPGFIGMKEQEGIDYIPFDGETD